MAITSEDKAIFVAQLCDERKGDDIAILNVAELSGFTDYLILVTGTSSTHLRAMAETCSVELKKSRILPLGVEGERSTGWLLMDYGDVVVHLFIAETRQYYGLERLWGDAESLEWRSGLPAASE
jgi:ribosome-associated protein